MVNARFQLCGLLAVTCLLFLAPTAVWGASIFGPSGAEASSRARDSFGDQFGFCDSGLLAISANCPLTAAFGGYSTDFGTHASLNTGDLSIAGAASGSPFIGGTATMQDTLYFHGSYRNDVDMGTITLTASGASGNGLLQLTEQFEDPAVFSGTQNQSINANTARPQGVTCNSRGYEPFVTLCESATSNSLMVSLTFPLDSNGLFFTASLTANVTGDGINWTDPISVELPAGVSFTSDSNQFLTGTAAPEPNALVTLAAGLILMICKARCWFRWRNPERQDCALKFI